MIRIRRAAALLAAATVPAGPALAQFQPAPPQDAPAIVQMQTPGGTPEAEAIEAAAQAAAATPNPAAMAADGIVPGKARQAAVETATRAAVLARRRGHRRPQVQKAAEIRTAPQPWRRGMG